MIALTWNFENEIGYPMVGGSTGGLKPFGFELLREMDGRGMLADVSHLNEAGFWDVVERAELPPVAPIPNAETGDPAPTPEEAPSDGEDAAAEPSIEAPPGDTAIAWGRSIA